MGFSNDAIPQAKFTMEDLMKAAKEGKSFVQESSHPEMLHAHLTEGTKHWMHNMSDQIQDKKLGQICIPGSHDSGTYDIKEDSTIDESSAPPVLRHLSNVPLLGVGIDKIIKRWAKTQLMTILHQLQAGIRYLDIRITGRGGTTIPEIWVTHSMLSVPLTTVIEDIRQFCKECPQEFVILDINHIYDMTPQQKDDMKTWINSMLPTAPQDEVLPMLQNSTLRQLWNTTVRVFVLYENGTSDSVVTTHWPNSNNDGEIIQFLENDISKRPTNTPLYVSQGIKTPDNGQIIGTVIHGVDNILAVARGWNGLVVRWYTDETKYKQNRNIIILDNANFEDSIQKIIHQNGNVSLSAGSFDHYHDMMVQCGHSRPKRRRI